MPWNPGVTDISGQLRAQGMINQAQGIGQGVANFAEQFAKSTEENAKFNAKNKAMENLVKTHAELFGLSDPEQLKGFLDTNPRESPIARYERLSTMVEGTVMAKKMQQMEEAKKGEAMQRQMQQMQLEATKQKMAQEAQDQAAFAAGVQAAYPTRTVTKPLLPGEDTEIPGIQPTQMEERGQFDPGAFLRATSANKMSMGGYDRVDQYFKMAMPQKQGRAIGPTVQIPGKDASGKDIITVRDSTTGEVLGVGPAFPPTPEVPNPLTQEMYKDLAKTRTEKALPAIQAAKTYEDLDAIINDPKQGVIAGKFADAELFAKSVANALGAEFTDVANTQQAKALFAAPVANMVKNFGAGTSISNADREYALASVGADFKMDATAIKRLIKIGKQVAEETRDAYQEQLDSTFPEDSDNPQFKQVRNALKLPKPKAKATAGISDERLEEIVKGARK